MNNENLKFNITLSGTHWNKLPEFSVWLDDEKITQEELKSNNHIIEFERTVDEADHTLKIRLENKNQLTDTLVENGEIVKDMLLNIDDISIDNISIGNLMWSAEYHLDTPQLYQGKSITQLDNCVNLGFNGTYILKFTSPFYLWLLEKL